MSGMIRAQNTVPQETNPQLLGAQLEKLLVQGDLSGLSAEQRVIYYNRVCESLGLNPLTRPFEYVSFQGKVILYARKDCTEQLRKIHGVSVTELQKEVIDDILLVTAKGRDRTGKEDTATGAVFIGGLRGEAKANAFMKGETKAKRRLTLSICGLAILDESEIETDGHNEPEYVVDSKWIPHHPFKHRTCEQVGEHALMEYVSKQKASGSAMTANHRENVAFIEKWLAERGIEQSAMVSSDENTTEQKATAFESFSSGDMFDQTKPRTRQEIAADILAERKRLNLGQEEAMKFIFEKTGKSPGDLTDEEMETVLQLMKRVRA